MEQDPNQNRHRPRYERQELIDIALHRYARLLEERQELRQRCIRAARLFVTFFYVLDLYNPVGGEPEIIQGDAWREFVLDLENYILTHFRPDLDHAELGQNLPF